jgi:hypothetical protein
MQKSGNQDGRQPTCRNHQYVGVRSPKSIIVKSHHDASTFPWSLRAGAKGYPCCLVKDFCDPTIMLRTAFFVGKIGSEGEWRAENNKENKKMTQT